MGAFVLPAGLGVPDRGHDGGDPQRGEVAFHLDQGPSAAAPGEGGAVVGEHAGRVSVALEAGAQRLPDRMAVLAARGVAGDVEAGVVVDDLHDRGPGAGGEQGGGAVDLPHRVRGRVHEPPPPLRPFPRRRGDLAAVEQDAVDRGPRRDLTAIGHRPAGGVDTGGGDVEQPPPDALRAVVPAQLGELLTGPHHRLADIRGRPRRASARSPRARGEPGAAVLPEPVELAVEHRPGHPMLPAHSTDIDLLAGGDTGDRGNERGIHLEPCSAHPGRLATNRSQPGRRKLVSVHDVLRHQLSPMS